MVKEYPKVSVVFLAGGNGSRMGYPIPKQYLYIHEKPIALYSFHVLVSLPEVQECVVVCAEEYEPLFYDNAHSFRDRLRFARAGHRRQDSVWNGIECIKHQGLICIHDAARPLIDAALVRRVIARASICGAAAAGVKARSTFKLCDEHSVVVNTPNRELLWEIQTPQVIELSLLKAGFRYAQANHLAVTDDLSLVELLGKPVEIVEGSFTNIKVTTPEDLICVEQFIKRL